MSDEYITQTVGGLSVTSWIPGEPTPAAHLTHYAFWNRWTPAERQAFLAAVANNIELLDFQNMVTWGTFVDLSLQTLIDAMNQIESIGGIIAAGRAAQIMSLTIQPQEYA